MNPSYRFVVTGRVQGVFFRQATVEKARELGLSGWVSNLADGRVEGVACGEAAALGSLRRWLQQGPPSARVDELLWESTEPVGESGEFVVLR